jgi:hypothetical protein
MGISPTDPKEYAKVVTLFNRMINMLFAQLFDNAWDSKKWSFS